MPAMAENVCSILQQLKSTNLYSDKNQTKIQWHSFHQCQ